MLFKAVASVCLLFLAPIVECVTSFDRAEYNYLNSTHVLVRVNGSFVSTLREFTGKPGHKETLIHGDGFPYTVMEDYYLDYSFRSSSGGIFGWFTSKYVVDNTTLKIWNLKDVYYLKQPQEYSSLEYGDIHSLVTINNFPVNRMSEFHNEALKNCELRLDYSKVDCNKDQKKYSSKALFLMEYKEQSTSVSTSEIVKNILGGSYNPDGKYKTKTNPFGKYKVVLHYRKDVQDNKVINFRDFEFEFDVLKPVIQSLDFGSDRVIEEGEFKVSWRSDKCANIDFVPINEALSASINLYHVVGNERRKLAKVGVDNYCRDEKYVTFKAPKLGENELSINLVATLVLDKSEFSTTPKVQTSGSISVNFKPEFEQDVRSWTIRNELMAGDTLDLTLYSNEKFKIGNGEVAKLNMSGESLSPIQLSVRMTDRDSSRQSVKYRLSIDWSKVPLDMIFKEVMITGNIWGSYRIKDNVRKDRFMDIRPVHLQLSTAPKINFFRRNQRLEDLTFFVGEKITVSLDEFPKLGRKLIVRLFADDLCLHDGLNLVGETVISPVKKAFVPKAVYLEIFEALYPSKSVKVPLSVDHVKFVDFKETNNIEIAILHKSLPTQVFNLDQDVSVSLSVKNDLPNNIEQVATMKVSLFYRSTEVSHQKWIISKSSSEFQWNINPRELKHWSKHGFAKYTVKVEYFDFEGASQVVNAPSATGSFQVKKPMISSLSITPAQFQVDGSEITVSWKVSPFCPFEIISPQSDSPFSALLEILDAQTEAVLEKVMIDDYCRQSSVTLVSKFLNEQRSERDIVARIESTKSHVLEILNRLDSRLPITISRFEESIFPGKSNSMIEFDVSSDPSLCSIDRQFELEFADEVMKGSEIKVSEAAIAGENSCVAKLELTWPSDLSPFNGDSKVVSIQGQMSTQSNKVRVFNPIKLKVKFRPLKLSFSHPTIADARAFFVGENLNVLLSSDEYDLKAEFCGGIDNNVLRIVNTSTSSLLMSFNVCSDMPMIQMPAKTLYSNDGLLDLSMIVVVGKVEFATKLPVIDPRIYIADSSVVLFQQTAQLNDEIGCSGSWKNPVYGSELLKRNVTLEAMKKQNDTVVSVYKSSKPIDLSSTRLPALFSLNETVSEDPFGQYYVQLAHIGESEIGGQVEFIPSNEETFRILRPRVKSLTFGAGSITAGQSFKLIWDSESCASLPSNSVLFKNGLLKAKLTVRSITSKKKEIFSANLDSYCTLSHQFSTEGIFKSDSFNELIAELTFSNDGDEVILTTESSLKVEPLPTSSSGPNIALIGGLTGGLALVIIIASIIIYKRYKLYKASKNMMGETHVFHSNPLYTSNYESKFTDRA